HSIRSDFVAAESEKFTRDLLNVSDAEPEAHQACADRHQAAAHQPGEAGLIARGSHCSLCTGDAVDQRLNCFGRPLVLEKVKDDAYRFFGDSIPNAGFRGQRANQFVHIPPPRPVVDRVSLAQKIILSFEHAKYKRSPRTKTQFIFIRAATV